MRRARSLVMVVLLLETACATPGPQPDALPEPLPAFQPLGRDFFVRQSVVARFTRSGEPDGEERRFEVALESRCGELRLVGLTRFGVRLFSAVRSPGGIDVQTLGGQELPFAPEWVLRDVERTFFRSDPPAADASGPDGHAARQTVVFGGESVTESWRDGHLVERRIAVGREPGDPPLVIRYPGPWLASGLSEHVTLSNPLVGYDLAIHNHEVRQLSCDPLD